METRDGFVFYRSFFEAIEDVNDKEKLKVFNAICKFALYGEEIELKGLANTLFKLIKPQLEANNKRFEDGKKGGRPKKETTGYSDKKTTGFEKEETDGLENKKPKEKEKVKDKEKEKVKDKEKTDLDFALDAFIEMRKKIKKPLTERALQMIINELNQIADNDEDKIKILDKSTKSCWLGVFPLKKEEIKETPKEVEEDYSNLEWNENHPLYDFAFEDGGYIRALAKNPNKKICKGDMRFG